MTHNDDHLAFCYNKWLCNQCCQSTTVHTQWQDEWLWCHPYDWASLQVEVQHCKLDCKLGFDHAEFSAIWKGLHQWSSIIYEPASYWKLWFRWPNMKDIKGRLTSMLRYSQNSVISLLRSCTACPAQEARAVAAFCTSMLTKRRCFCGMPTLRSWSIITTEKETFCGVISMIHYDPGT